MKAKKTISKDQIYRVMGGTSHIIPTAYLEDVESFLLFEYWNDSAFDYDAYLEAKKEIKRLKAAMRGMNHGLYPEYI